MEKRDLGDLQALEEVAQREVSRGGKEEAKKGN